MQALLTMAPIDEMSAEYVDNMLQITEHIQRNAAVLAERSSSAVRLIQAMSPQQIVVCLLDKRDVGAAQDVCAPGERDARQSIQAFPLIPGASPGHVTSLLMSEKTVTVKTARLHRS